MPARMPSTAFGGCVAENRSSGMRLPWVVAAEPPQVALDIAAGVAAPAVVLVGDVHDDGRAGVLGPCVVLVGVGADHAGALRRAPADLFGLRDRSEGRRGGKACVRRCSSRWLP